MQEKDLTLVGLTGDTTKLVLVSGAGEEFTLAADAKLRAALRGDHARLGQLETTMESALRPRDIQARIRAGETPESVASGAQTSLERVMTYATPVLAERAHVADRAQRASVKRRSGEGVSRVLGEAVADRLRSRDVSPSSVEWDAWRRQDGRWTLVADYGSGDGARHAEFSFDAPGRYVVAEDDEARWLVGETTAVGGPQLREGDGSAGRRLSAVPTDDELPLGEDAIDLVSEPSPVSRSESEGGFPAADEEPTVDLTGTARAVRAGASTDTGVEEKRIQDRADWIASPTDERPAEGVSEAELVEEPVAESVAEEGNARRGKKGRGRASVPSWDEIMFGGGKPQ